MVRLELGELATLIVGILALFLGRAIRQGIPLLRRLDMPNAVVGGLVVALLILAGQLWFDIGITFASELRNLLLLVFFTTIGLSAKVAALRAGGKPLVILCVVTILALVAQNLGGAVLAALWGVNPAYGVLAGALSFVGGPGTALAWAGELEKQGLTNASVVGIGAATLATVAGALVAGPIAGMIITRHRLTGPRTTEPEITFAPPESAAPRGDASVEALLMTIFVLATAVYMGEWINGWAAHAGFLLPGFLCAMLAGVAITNLADVFGLKLDFAPIEKGGAVALQIFLVIALMATPLIAVGAILLPLALNVVIQVALTAAIAYFILFRALGRDYDSAVTVGGFLGLGLASMPVGMATMDEVGRRYGPSPKAFLLVTLAGSFFVDLANAFVAKAFLALPMFEIVPKG